MGKPWFHVKRYGLGAGLPCSWEGWAVTAAFLVALFAVGLLTEKHAGFRIPAILIATAAFCVVARLKSDGPWKWRWGQD